MEKEAAIVQLYTDDGMAAYPVTNEHAIHDDEGKEIVSELKKDISNKITKFYASNQGETHLADSDNGKIMDMRVYGRSEQKQYRGKNLLPTTMYDNSTVQNGIQFTNNRDGSVTVSGTATDITYFKLWGYNELSDKGILPGLKVGDTVFVSDCLLQETNSKELLKITTNSAVTINSSTTTMFVGIKINKNTTINKTYYPQIEKGSEATSYEPYVGGQPSPSSDYPQEIKSVVNPVVKICGKNLLKATLKTQEKYGISCKNNNDGTYTFNGTITADGREYIDFYFAGYYYASKPINNGGAFIGTIGLENAIDGISILAINNTKVLASGDNLMKGKGPVACFMMRIKKGVVLDNLVIKPMIVAGDLDDNYFEEYKEQVATFPYTLNAIPVTKDGNYTDKNGQQYISDYVDIENKKLIRKVGDVTFNGKEYWIEEACTLGLRYSCYIKNAKETAMNVGNNSLNSASILGAKEITYTSPNLYTISNQKIYVSWNGTETLEEFKAKLQDTPMRVIYELANSEEIDLTDEELEAFKKLETYYPVTNILTTSDELDGYTTFNYPVSLENGWNYVKQQLGDNRDYIYNIDNRAQEIDMQSAEAYVNSEYAVALTELEVM